MLLGWLLYRRPWTRVQLAGMAVSYTGVLLVFGQELSLEGSNVISLPLSSTFKAGMYVVEVNNGTELQSSKFVKQ
jgi:drug/metabolite transporter (DMT)-like permease